MCKKITTKLSPALVGLSLITTSVIGETLGEKIDPVSSLFEQEAKRHYFSYKATGILPDFSRIMARRPTRDEAYEFQEYYAKSFLDDGDSIIGYKLGFTGKTAPPGAAAPLLGRLFHSQLIKSGGSFSFADLENPILEVEMAFRFKKDLKVGANLDDIRDAIGEVSIAIEVPNPNYKQKQDFDGINFIAHSVVSRRLMIGNWVEYNPERVNINNIKATLTKPDNSKLFFSSDNVLPNNNQHQFAAIKFAANELGGRNHVIKKGDILITGSMGSPLFGARVDNEKHVEDLYKMTRGEYIVDYGDELGTLRFQVTD